MPLACRSRDLRVPLAEFAEQGVDLTSVRKIELRFAGEGMPQSGSIQLADVRFEQPASGFSNVLLDSTTPNAAAAGKVNAACHAEGVLTLTCGTFGNVFRFLPPLVIGDDLLEEALTVLDKALATVS